MGDATDIVEADGEVAEGFGGGDPVGEVPGDGEGFVVGGGGAVPVAAGLGDGADIVEADGEVTQGFGGGDPVGEVPGGVDKGVQRRLDYPAGSEADGDATDGIGKRPGNPGGPGSIPRAVHDEASEFFESLAGHHRIGIKAGQFGGGKKRYGTLRITLREIECRSYGPASTVDVMREKARGHIHQAPGTGILLRCWREGRHRCEEQGRVRLRLPDGNVGHTGSVRLWRDASHPHPADERAHGPQVTRSRSGLGQPTRPAEDHDGPLRRTRETTAQFIQSGENGIPIPIGAGRQVDDR